MMAYQMTMRSPAAVLIAGNMSQKNLMKRSDRMIISSRRVSAALWNQLCAYSTRQHAYEGCLATLQAPAEDT